MEVNIIALGTLKNGPYFDAIKMYEKRLHWNVSLTILESKKNTAIEKAKDEHQKILNALDSSAYTIALDERGKTISSSQFADQFLKLQNQGRSKIQIIIGGADGLNDENRNKCDFLLSFGAQTWPHMLVRVMLYEQLYRAQQILNGHPYHRDS